ncbi:hypothetical protein ACROYT_G044595 [Oculina patagonica]
MDDPFATSPSESVNHAANNSELASVMEMLEAEPESTKSAMKATIQGPDIPALREQLAILVSTAKAKEAIGVQMTYEQVKRLTDKEVEKYFKRYEAYVGAKTTDSLIDSFIFLATKVVATKPDKNPKRVAAGKLAAEKTRQAREAQKKAAVEAAAIIAKEKENKSASAKRNATPPASPEDPPESSGLSTNQWISLLSIGVAIITTYVKREDIKAFFKKKSREVQTKSGKSNFVQESEAPGPLSSLKLRGAELSSRIPRPKRGIRPMD